MKKAYVLAVVGVGLLLLSGAPTAKAACGFTPQSLIHISSFFDNCADANPVAGYAWKIGDAVLVNSTNQDLACEVKGGTTDAGQTCNAGGVAGDGIVTVLYDWGDFNPTASGCPNPDQAVNGSNPIAVQITDNNGASVIATIGYSLGFAGYAVDSAQPQDSGTGAISPISCTFDNAPSIISITAGPTPETHETVCVNLGGVTTHSDCDAGTFGDGLGTCSGRTRPPSTSGDVYTTVAPCGQQPDPRRSAWTLVGPPDGAGDLCFQAPDVAAGECAYVGQTGILGFGGPGTCVIPPPVDLGPCFDIVPPLGFFRCTLVPTLECDPNDPDSCIVQTPGSCQHDSGILCENDAECTIAPPPTPTIVGSFQIAGPAAASDRAVLRLAELGKNVLSVRFTVSLEQNARSFDVIADGRAINSSPILAEGLGSYTATIEGAGRLLKGAKSVTIRTNLEGPGTLMSEPLSIKRNKK